MELDIAKQAPVGDVDCDSFGAGEDGDDPAAAEAGGPEVVAVGAVGEVGGDGRAAHEDEYGVCSLVEARGF